MTFQLASFIGVREHGVKFIHVGRPGAAREQTGDRPNPETAMARALHANNPGDHPIHKQ